MKSWTRYDEIWSEARRSSQNSLVSPVTLAVLFHLELIEADKVMDKVPTPMPWRSTHAPEVPANAVPELSVLPDIQTLDTGGRTYTLSEVNHAFFEVLRKRCEEAGSAISPRAKANMYRSNCWQMREMAKELKNMPGETPEDTAAGQPSSVANAADAVAEGLKKSLEQIKELRELTDQLALDSSAS